MTEFTPLQSAFGGALIGLSAVLLMALLGRVAGMTGILSGAIFGPDRGWRLAFLAGAIAAPILMGALGAGIAFDSPVPRPFLVLGGLLGAVLGYFAFPAILVALFFQAVMFGHGGLTTLGINGVILGLPSLLSAMIFRGQTQIGRAHV